MVESVKLTLPALFAETLRKYPLRPALALLGEEPLTYLDTDQKIRSVIAMLEHLGIEAGDRVAILGSNMPNWCISYYAVTFMGAIVVPVLPDFHPDEIENILVHSGARALFVTDSLRKKITENLLVMIRMEDFSLITRTAEPVFFTAGENPSRQYNVNEEDVAAFIYTSGTTGKSKGVMLTHKNLAFTARMSGRVQEVNEQDRFLSVLPLSHTYENTIGMLLPMLSGSVVYYLGKPPTPSLLLPALKTVRPTMMLTVPLIIEKIFRNVIQPKFTKNPVLHLLIRFPVTRKLLNRLAGKKLMETFGGELKFFGIGGAKLNRSVEKFLIEARFPYAIGYGMTEASPLLAGFNPQGFKLQSTGRAIENVELKINHPDLHGEGEIWARGDNVMKGYYKEPALTAEIKTEDGWLKTGDLGTFDKDGYLFIKGRLKNMIVLSGGENIYPEEIESVINNFRHVNDSLVLEQKGKLVALVHFNREEIEEHYSHLRQEIMDFVDKVIEDLKTELQQYVNRRVNRFSQVQVVLVQPVPFEKTATQKIKRYLYS
ncbi:MAG: AMP-binding protein [Syntrophothermus sp.]